MFTELLLTNNPYLNRLVYTGVFGSFNLYFEARQGYNDCYSKLKKEEGEDAYFQSKIYECDRYLVDQSNALMTFMFAIAIKVNQMLFEFFSVKIPVRN